MIEGMMAWSTTTRIDATKMDQIAKQCSAHKKIEKNESEIKSTSKLSKRSEKDADARVWKEVSDDQQARRRDKSAITENIIANMTSLGFVTLKRQRSYAGKHKS